MDGTLCAATNSVRTSSFASSLTSAPRERERTFGYLHRRSDSEKGPDRGGLPLDLHLVHFVKPLPYHRLFYNYIETRALLRRLAGLFFQGGVRVVS